MSQSERLPPHNIEAEKAALGCVFIKPDAYDDLAAILVADDFFLPAHREVFESMKAVTKRQMPCDPITVGDELKARGTLPRLEGGERYLMDMAEAVPTAETMLHYVRIVKDAANLRRLIILCGQTMSRAYGGFGERDVDEFLEDVAGSVSRLIAGTAATKLVTVGTLVPGRIRALEDRSQAGPDKPVNVVRTGLHGLDELIYGAEPGNLIFIGAETGGGKTAFANQVALNHCMNDGGTALVCELEMTNAELADRAIVHVAQVNSRTFKRGDIDAADWRKIFATAGRLTGRAGSDSLEPASEPLLYLDDRSRTVREIAAKARHWRARHPDKLGLLIIDFLQLVRMADRGRGSRADELSTICGDLKQLGKDLGVVVAIPAQFNREANKSGEAPSIYDFKDSSSIEQLADFIILLWNHSGPENTPTEDGPVDCIVGKNRNGPKRTIPLFWKARYFRFFDGDTPWPDQGALPFNPTDE